MGAAIQVAVEHPVFGSGLGMNLFILNEIRGSTWVQVHNVYLTYAADLGFPGLLLFVALFASVMRAVWKVRRGAVKARQYELGLLASGILVSLAGFMVAGVFYPVAYHAHFFLIAGLAAAAWRAGHGLQLVGRTV